MVVTKCPVNHFYLNDQFKFVVFIVIMGLNLVSIIAYTLAYFVNLNTNSFWLNVGLLLGLIFVIASAAASVLIGYLYLQYAEDWSQCEAAQKARKNEELYGTPI